LIYIAAKQKSDVAFQEKPHSPHDPNPVMSAALPALAMAIQQFTYEPLNDYFLLRS
jgi:hypothetical protein